MTIRLCIAAFVLLAFPHVAHADAYGAYETGYTDGQNDAPRSTWNWPEPDRGAYVGAYQDSQTEAQDDEDEDDRWAAANEAASHRDFDIIGHSEPRH